MILKHQHIDLAGKIVFERIAFQAPMKSNSSMKDEACFMHVLKGSSRLYLPNTHIKVEGKDNLLMKCGRYLNDWFENEEGEANEAVLVHFYPDVLEAVFEEEIPDFLQKKNGLRSPQALKIRSDEMIRNYIQSLLYCFDQIELLTESWIKLKLKEIIFILANSAYAEAIRDILSDLFNENQHSFKEIIQSHLYDDLNTKDLAMIAGYSLSSFKRKFKHIFGTSPNRYIRGQRLQKARKLLTHTNQRISEIAYDCGFNDLGYFSRSFSTFFEHSPSDYRKLHRMS